MLKIKPIKAFLAMLLMFLFSASCFAAPFHWSVSSWTKLTEGLYWVGPGDTYCPANTNIGPKTGPKPVINPACSKAYDPKKPTLIFIHGWEPGSVRTLSRFDFYDPVQGLNPKDDDLGKIWRDKGWNVGVFYWNQISDTSFPSQAAAKIWTTKSSQHMDWKDYNPNAKWTYNKVVDKNACQNSKSPYCKSVGDMAYEDYVNALKNYQGKQIRIVGHSLGGQLATYLTHKIVTQVNQGKLSPNLLPHQLVLLDPYLSEDNTYLDTVGINNHKLFNQYIKQIAFKYGVVVSEYLSSDLTLPDEWSPAENIAAVTFYRPWFDKAWREDQKHSAAWLLYLQSMKDNPPKTYENYNVINHEDLPSKIPGMSASTPIYANNSKSAIVPIDGLASMMGKNTYWDQDCGENGKLCGEYSVDTSKDGFLEKRNTYANDPLPTQILIQDQGSYIVKNASINMTTGSTKHLKAKIYPYDAENQIVLWKSSNSKIAKVYPGGYVKAVQPGNVTVTAIAPYLNDGTTGQIKVHFTVQVN